MTRGNDFLILKDAVLGYPGSTPTSPLSIGFPRGKLSALIGPNGSGKTTLLRAALGEKLLLSGNIHVGREGKETHLLSSEERAATLAYLPQEHTFPPELELRALLALSFLPELGAFGRLKPKHEREIDQMLGSLGLGALAARSLKQLSTGERQRAFLARALLQRPQLLLLDEPTNHLDPGAVEGFWSLLMEQRSLLGFDVLVSTHDLGFVESRAEHVVALTGGKLVYSGLPAPFWQRGGVKELFGLRGKA